MNRATLTISGNQQSTQVMTKNLDTLTAYLGDERARVRITLEERLSRPGTYSSVSLHCTVELTCGQTKKAVDATKDLALAECMTFIDANIENAMALLDAHLAKL